MEGRLLSRDQYDSLLAQATLDGLVHGLRSLPYARALEPVLATLDRAQGLRTIGCLDEALRRDLVETLGILRGSSPIDRVNCSMCSSSDGMSTI